jgi:hypothetical protein
MTGFEYTAAVHMLYEGQTDDGLNVIAAIRERYDGLKRNPFDEAECGHHYARAMAAWASILALTGFQYSGVEQSITFAPKPGTHFWANGYAWGQCRIEQADNTLKVILTVLGGNLVLRHLKLAGGGEAIFKRRLHLGAGKMVMLAL